MNLSSPNRSLYPSPSVSKQPSLNFCVELPGTSGQESGLSPDKLSPKQIVGLRKAFNEEEDDADSDDEEEDENATGGNFLSSFFGSNRRSSQSKSSKKNVNNNRDDDDHHQSNDIDQAWLDGRENNGMYYIKYLDLATIDDFGRNLIKPDNGNENNQRNSRL